MTEVLCERHHALRGDRDDCPMCAWEGERKHAERLSVFVEKFDAWHASDGDASMVAWNELEMARRALAGTR